MTGSERSGEGAAALLAVVIEGWRLVMLVAAATAIVTVGLLLLARPRYSAQVTLATVSTMRLPQLGDLAASLAGAALAARGGFEASPALVQEFLTLPSVLTQVGEAPAPDGRRMVDAVADEDSGGVARGKVARTMRDAVATSMSDKTGLITVRVALRDSALARAVVTKLIEQTRHDFVQTARAQASAQRAAQMARVDSASRQLRAAERELAAFQRTHRIVASFSEDAIQQAGLQQAVDIARQVYIQAVTSREAAIAKELEETPAVVVVDGLPEVLPAVPLRRGVKLVLAVIAATLATSLYLIARDARADLAGDPSSRRLREAVSALPLVGRWLRRHDPA